MNRIRKSVKAVDKKNKQNKILFSASIYEQIGYINNDKEVCSACVSVCTSVRFLSKLFFFELQYKVFLASILLYILF